MGVPPVDPALKVKVIWRSPPTDVVKVGTPGTWKRLEKARIGLTPS